MERMKSVIYDKLGELGRKMNFIFKETDQKLSDKFVTLPACGTESSPTEHWRMENSNLGWDVDMHQSCSNE